MNLLENWFTFLVGYDDSSSFQDETIFYVSSSQNVQYGCRICGISLILLGHPIIIVCFNSASSLSAWVACQISCKLSFWLGVDVKSGIHGVLVV